MNFESEKVLGKKLFLGFKNVKDEIECLLSLLDFLFLKGFKNFVIGWLTGITS